MIPKLHKDTEEGREGGRGRQRRRGRKKLKTNIPEEHISKNPKQTLSKPNLTAHENNHSSCLSGICSRGTGMV